MTRKKWGLGLIFNLVLIVAVIGALFPVLFIAMASLRPGQTLYATGLSLWPKDATVENFRYMLFERPFLTWLKNSLFVAGFTTVFGLSVATTAGYAFSRWRFLGHKQTLMLFLALQAFPGLLTLVPIYVILRSLGLVNNHWGLIVAYTSGALVFCVWNMKGYFDTIPNELEEAALIDGATPTQAFLRVVLPLAQPALAVTALFAFLGGWNEFAMANVLLTGEKTWTLPVGLWALQENYRLPWGWFAAGSLMNAIPVMLLFLGLQRFLVSGLTLGGVKG